MAKNRDIKKIVINLQNNFPEIHVLETKNFINYEPDFWEREKLLYSIVAKVLKDAGSGLDIKDRSLVISNRARKLAFILRTLQPELDNYGRMSIGDIWTRYNQTAPNGNQYRLGHPAQMGNLLRTCGLSTPKGEFKIFGKSRHICFQWDKKTDEFLEQILKQERIEANDRED